MYNWLMIVYQRHVVEFLRQNNIYNIISDRYDGPITEDLRCVLYTLYTIKGYLLYQFTSFSYCSMSSQYLNDPIRH